MTSTKALKSGKRAIGRTAAKIGAKKALPAKAASRAHQQVLAAVAALPPRDRQLVTANPVFESIEATYRAFEHFTEPTKDLARAWEPSTDVAVIAGRIDMMRFSAASREGRPITGLSRARICLVMQRQHAAAHAGAAEPLTLKQASELELAARPHGAAPVAPLSVNTVGRHTRALTLLAGWSRTWKQWGEACKAQTPPAVALPAMNTHATLVGPAAQEAWPARAQVSPPLWTPLAADLPEIDVEAYAPAP